MKIPWLVLQLSDSGFPSGGFAHSFGLEAWATYNNPVSLETFVRNTLWQIGQGVLPLATAAHREPNRWAELDKFAETVLIHPVINQASRTQGRAFYDTCARIYSLLPAAERGITILHHAPTFGALLRELEIDETAMQQLFLNQSLRGILSAATRLGLVGTHQAQTLTHKLGPFAEQVLTECANFTEKEVKQTSPITDLFASLHDRLYSRLFLS
jgi:urease accessory protein